MTTAKMIVGIMKMMAAVMTADETAAMPSHVSLHDSAHHAVSSFVPQSARHSVRADADQQLTNNLRGLLADLRSATTSQFSRLPPQNERRRSGWRCA